MYGRGSASEKEMPQKKMKSLINNDNLDFWLFCKQFDKSQIKKKKCSPIFVYIIFHFKLWKKYNAISSVLPFHCKFEVILKQGFVTFEHKIFKTNQWTKKKKKIN